MSNEKYTNFGILKTDEDKLRVSAGNMKKLIEQKHWVEEKDYCYTCSNCGRCYRDIFLYCNEIAICRRCDNQFRQNIPSEAIFF